MNLTEYQAFVESLASSRSKRDHESRLLTFAVGLSGEAGETADLVKKHVFHSGPLLSDKIQKELGDILWYIAFACNTMGWTIQEVIDANVEKLQARYPSGQFSVSDFLAKESAKEST